MNIKKILFPFFMVLSISIFGFSDETDYITTAIYDNEIPQNIAVDLKYPAPKILDYVFVRSRIANLREEPNSSSKIIKKYYYNSKLIALKKVEYYGNSWYYAKDKNGNVGYISANLVRKRMFRFQKALDKIDYIEDFIKNQTKLGREIASTISYVPNPKNQNFKREKDKYGTTLDQSTIGFDKKGEEIYIPDRSIIAIIKKGKKTSLVKVAGIPEELFISNKKIAKTPNINANFNKVVAIDISNQNIMIFQKDNNIWEVISYVYSKTGIESKLGFPTPRGFFVTPTVKYVMPYNDEGGLKQGYARFAIRFSGGGYLHGTPINYDEDINKEFFMKQKEHTLGTFTGTRKCIRTTENHAKFLFNWIMPKPNHRVNIQRVKDDVFFIIF